MDPARPRRKDAGFTLFEILLTLLIMGVALVPLLDAFRPAMAVTAGEARQTVFSHQAQATLSRTAALPFATLDANQGDPVDLAVLFGSAVEAAEEQFAFEGRTYTPAVAVTDASGGEGGLLAIRVSVAEVALETLVADGG